MLRMFLLCVSLFGVFAAEIGPALPNAHSHNDYEHKRPLLDALSQGFSSVEADVYLVDGRLLVAHDRKDVRPDRTLEALYLDPLKKFSGGRKSIFPEGGTLTLLIDIKTEAEATYRTLKTVLEKYSSMLTEFRNGQIQTNVVTVILSGNRPREMLLAEQQRFASYDGRLADLGHQHPVSFMPLVSDNWRSHFAWTGEGAFPAIERQKLRDLVKQAHAEKKRIRFWASPDTKDVWRELRDAGVDLINTDDLPALAAFLRTQ